MYIKNTQLLILILTYNQWVRIEWGEGFLGRDGHILVFLGGKRFIARCSPHAMRGFCVLPPHCMLRDRRIIF
ncbi:MAG: hypothetical protein WAW86_07785, partial [Gammaproteobacteria bacterium]